MLRGSAAWGQAASAAVVSLQSPPICLNVSEQRDKLLTKNYSFTGILRSDALTLENLRELTACRAQAYENSSVTAEERLSWIQRYLALLTNFAGKAAAMDGNNEEALQFEWTSPLAGAPSTFSKVKGVIAEQAMACITYAAALEKQACALAIELAQQDLEQLRNLPEQHAAAAALYRRAAGVYEHASEEYVSQLTGAKQADRPAELRHDMVTALSKMAQGQAQAICAHRAQVKNTTPSALASLYCGAIDLFEEASAVLKSSKDVKQTAESLRKVLALSSSYNRVKAWQAMASHEAAQSDMGLACADLQEARRLAQESCQVAQGNSDWQQAFQQQIDVINQQLLVYDRERQIVYFQAIARHCSQPPQGKVLVKVIEFEPLKLQHELG